jgi:hypothetical protein
MCPLSLECAQKSDSHCFPTVVNSPAPDLRALLAKIEIIHECQLDSDDDVRRTPIEVLRDDLRHFKKG